MNGVEDAADIQAGVSADCNQNGVPDVCDLVPLTFAAIGDPVALPGTPRRLASGDFDGDGRRDVIIAVEAPLSRVSIFLSRGAGVFTTAPALASPGLAALEIADLDSDGDLDIVTAGGDALRVYLNDAAAGFATPLQVATSPAAEQLQVGDVDLDGSPDLVTLNPSQGNVTWYRSLYRDLRDGSLGEKSFSAEPSVEVAQPVGNSPLTRLFLAAADFDGDGDVDFAVAGGRERTVRILESTDGGGGLPVVQSFPASGPLTALAVGDLTGDGLADVAAATQRRTVLVWRNGGPDGFAEPSTMQRSSDFLVLADVDRDGATDLLARGRDAVGPTVDIFRGAGDGTFLSSESFAVEGAAFAADDFDGDRDVDLAVAWAGGMTVLLQGERGRQGDLIFDGTEFKAAGAPHSMDVGDFNGDGIPDVVTANRAPPQDSYTLFFGRRDGSLERHAVRPLATIIAVVVFDTNGDGGDDLVFRRITGEVLVLLNQGGGEFSEPVSFGPVAGFAQHLEKADVDGDGHVDILSVDWRSDRFTVCFGDGRGRLGESQVLEVGMNSRDVDSGDLDGDGDVDLVVANETTSDLSILFQEEPRRFAAAVMVPMTTAPVGVALADFDLDGDLDVVTANPAAAYVAIFLNPGDGAIDAPAHRFPLGRSPRTLEVVDLDQDGFVDLAVTTGTFSQISAEDGVSVLRGRGDGTFSQLQHFRTSTNPRTVRSRDMDGDGDIDLVVAHRWGANVVVLLNQTVPSGSNVGFLTSVCTPLDYELVSVPDGLSSGPPLSERRTSFLLPARGDPGLLPTSFVNVARFPRGVDFLRETFPERFGELGEMGFADLALRRGSRDYVTGSIRRLRLAADRLVGGSVVYGFDVLTAAAEVGELLSREETRDVSVRLRESFLLEPLVYFPSDPSARQAARDWDAPDLPVILAPDGPPEEPLANPTFHLDIPADTVLCGVFLVAGANRGAREEHELKSHVRLRQGTLALPTKDETFTTELFEEVVFGPDGVRAEAQKSGTVRVVRIAGEVTTYRFSYAQPFILPGGRILELEVVTPFTFQARGEKPLKDSQALPDEFFVVLKGREPLQARLDGEPLVHYGSCTYDSLPLWEIQGRLRDGSTFRLEERFQEATSFFDTAPASLVHAEITLGQEKRVVTDYFDLVYSASRHNTFVDYRIVFDPPVAVQDVGWVHGVELQAPESSVPPFRNAQAAYLGADFEVLSSLRVIRFERAPLRNARYLRGDASGDGALDVVDAIGVLRFLFEAVAELSCLKAADANDDGRINIVDPIAVLSVLFGRSGALPEPFLNCGGDPTEDALSCRRVASCP